MPILVNSGYPQSRVDLEKSEKRKPGKYLKTKLVKGQVVGTGTCRKGLSATHKTQKKERFIIKKT